MPEYAPWLTAFWSTACWMAWRTRMSWSLGCSVLSPSHMYCSAPATVSFEFGGVSFW